MITPRWPTLQRPWFGSRTPGPYAGVTPLAAWEPFALLVAAMAGFVAIAALPDGLRGLGLLVLVPPLVLLFMGVARQQRLASRALLKRPTGPQPPIGQPDRNTRAGQG